MWELAGRYVQIVEDETVQQACQKAGDETGQMMRQALQWMKPLAQQDMAQVIWGLLGLA
ncbi:MAG: hypothetical protein LBF94_00555 [Puniceicoccales bacterium]|nr:hypothetical protein [Puniceicoccales bacterium]